MTSHTLVDPIDLARRPGGGDDNLAAAIEQGIDDVLEFLLGVLALHELQIVDQEHVDRTEAVLEGHRLLGLKRLDEGVAEALRGQVEDLRLGHAAANFPRHRLKEVGLAEADGGVDVERVEAAGLGKDRIGDLARAGMRHAVRSADHEAVEGQARVEGRAFEAGRLGRRAGRNVGGSSRRGGPAGLWRHGGRKAGIHRRISALRTIAGGFRLARGGGFRTIP